MKINIEFVPHEMQRYNTAGDWWLDTDTDTIQIRVSHLSDHKYEQLVALHEVTEVLVENILRGDSIYFTEMEQRATTFDKEFKGESGDEPGYVPAAPYYRGHMLASAVEHLAAMLLGIDYNQYDRDVAALDKSK